MFGADPRFIVCALGLLLPCACAKKEAASPTPSPEVHVPLNVDRAPATELEGMWIVIEATDKGTKVPVDELGNREISFEGDLIFVRDARDPSKVSARTTFQIDPVRRPKTIDMSYTDGPDKGKTDHGIYSLEGNLLRLCMNQESGGERPKQFASRPGTTFNLMVLKRVE